MKQVGTCIHICIAGLQRLLILIFWFEVDWCHQTFCARKALASMMHELWLRRCNAATAHEFNKPAAYTRH